MSNVPSPAPFEAAEFAVAAHAPPADVNFEFPMPVVESSSATAVAPAFQVPSPVEIVSSAASSSTGGVTSPVGQERQGSINDDDVVDDVVGADAVSSVCGGDPGADGAGGGSCSVNSGSGNSNPEHRVGVGGRVMKGMQAGHRIARPNNGGCSGGPSVSGGASSNASSSSPPVGTWLTPLRKRGDSEEGSEIISRGGSTPGGAKRRRRDGTDVPGHRICHFKLTADDNVDFMNRIRDLYDSRRLCDVTLRVEGEEFRAHKAVLACSRSFLGAMMMSGMREMDQDVIELRDISAREFKILLDFIYNKMISVPSPQVVDLLALATRYQVEGLKVQMCQALLANLDHDNACSVFAAADNYECPDLKEQAFSRIVQHFALAARSEGWVALTRGQLSEVLCSDQVLDCDESVVFDAAVRWLQADAPARRKFTSQVLGMVRFPLMDAGLLSDVIKKHELTQGPECQALIAEAWEHHALKAVGREGLTGTPRTKQRRRSCSFKKHTLLTEHSDAVSALDVVNGKLVSGSWDTNIKVWDPQSWTTERTLSDHTGPVRCFAQCADRLLSGSDDGSVKVWNTETWSLVRSLDDHTDAVNAVIDCAGRLASGSDDGTIKLWNTANWQCEVTIHQADHTCGVLALATCGDFLVSGSDGGIKVWNTHNWTCHKEVLGHGDEIWALAVVGDKLISGSIDSTIRVWETQTWGCEKLLEDHHGPVYALTVLEGKLVSASSDHTIRVWGADWACCRVLECSGVWSLNVFNDRLVSGSLDNAVKVWGA